jgi:O-antigen/teichoic acid export membrane protein
MDDTEKEDSYSHILKYTGLFGGVQGLGIMVGIVRNKLVAMILGPDGMGLVSLFNSTIKLLSDSTNCGISMSGVKNVSEAYMSGDASQLRHAVDIIRLWSFLTAFVGMTLCVVLSPLLSRWTFSWGDHTLHFIGLSPVVALLAVTGGESAILKGTRQLRHLAAISVYGILAVLFCTVPLYYYFGQQGIVPSLVLAALAQCIITVAYSYRLFPLHLHFNRSLLGEGSGMVRLGIAFVLAGILGSGADFLIRSYLNTEGELLTVGLYNAGYMLTMTYAGMVFSAMESDYFPRLSGIPTLGPQLNQAVNHQVEVSLLLISPMLVAFIIGLPILLPLLYSGKFLPVLGMMRVTVLAMYCRAMSLPVEYITLSRGDSRSYLIMEAFYDVAVVILVVCGFHYGGLTGTGYGLLAASVLNLVMVLVYCRFCFRFSLSATVVRYLCMQLPLGLLAVALSLTLTGWVYWLLGVLLALVSLAITLVILRSKTNLWTSLVDKLRKHKRI